MFVDTAAVVVDQAVDGLEEARRQLVNLLGAEFPDERRITDDVGEERRHLAPFAPGRRIFRHRGALPQIEGRIGA